MQKIFVGGLPHGTDDLQLRQWVEGHGFTVERVQIITDHQTGNSRGFAFVTLGGNVEVRDAIAAMHGKTLGTRKITIGEAVPKPNYGDRSYAAKA